MIKGRDVTYNGLLRLVHPDLNPEAVDASARIALLKRFKDDNETLVELGRSWGLVEQPDPSDIPLPDNAFERETGNPINTLMLGSKVITPDQSYVVVDIKKGELGYAISCIEEEEKALKIFERPSKDQDALFYSVGPHPKYSEYDLTYQMMGG